MPVTLLPEGGSPAGQGVGVEGDLGAGGGADDGTFARPAGDGPMARTFHVKHTPIPAVAHGRSSSSVSSPCRAPPGGTTASASAAAMPRSMAGPL